MFFRIGAAIIIIICVLLLVLALGANAANAIDLDHKGLAITPTTQDVTVTAGKVTNKKIEIANHTDKPLTVTLQVKEFETTDYTYDFSFKDPKNDWIYLKQNQIELEPRQKTTVDAVIDVPAEAAPKSYYFAVLASADMSTVGFRQTAQVVSLLMIKIDGKWIQTGVINNSSVPFFNFDSQITYRFDAENTGNVHYNIVVFGQIENLWGSAEGKQQGAGHVLVPGAKRTIEGSVASPVLPGLYKFTYGYTLGSGSAVTSNTVLILFIPPWAIAAAAICVFVVVKLCRSKIRRANNTA